MRDLRTLLLAFAAGAVCIGIMFFWFIGAMKLAEVLPEVFRAPIGILTVAGLVAIPAWTWFKLYFWLDRNLPGG